MRLNDKLIRIAIQAIEQEKIVENGEYSSQYNGYIASFGAAVIQSGLLPAVIFFENTNANSEEKRFKVIHALVFILNNHFAMVDVKLPFHKYLLEEGCNTSDILKNVNQAVAALKLALRTFKKKEDEEKAAV